MTRVTAAGQMSVRSAISDGATGAPTPPSTYVVQPGDTFWAIASKALGDGNRWREIWNLNRDSVPNPDSLQPGVALKLPGGTDQPTQPVQPGYQGTSTMDPTPVPGTDTPPATPQAPEGSLAANPLLSFVVSGGVIKRTGEIVPGIDAVQRRLIALGYPVDLGANDSNAGRFGPGTEAQLAAFQRDQGLPITGALDRATLLALDAAKPAVVEQRS